MLFYGIDRKNHIKETQLFSHTSTYILWVHNLNTKIFWGKLNNSKYEAMVIVMLKWIMDCILQALHDVRHVESSLVGSAHLFLFFRCSMTSLIKRKIGRT